MGTLTFQAAAGGSLNLLGPNIAGTVNLTLPSADGTSGQALQTNGSGTLSFANLGTAAGGTGLTSFTSTGIPYASSTSALTTGSALTFDGTNLATTGSLNSTNTFGFKNRIINGGMVIDQRNGGASVTPTDGQYTLDRWQAGVSQASKLTIQQSGSANPGFPSALLVTSSSAYSVLAADYFGVVQYIEGYNMADLAWGTANAKSVTLSAWVYSSLTGTFGGSLRNSASNRSYPFTYSIPTANTWTQISVTIAGDTSGTWLTTNGIGIRVWFSVGAGSTFSSTAGAWATGNYVSATGAVSVVGTNGATFYITGVQLEKGSTATSFDFRSYGTELALCQRYYCIFDSAAGAAYSTAGASANAYSAFYFPVTMRSAPTIAAGTLTVSTNLTTDSLTATTQTQRGGFYQIVQGAAAGNYIGIRTANTATSEL
jgi:hypothetical protein